MKKRVIIFTIILLILIGGFFLYKKDSFFSKENLEIEKEQVITPENQEEPKVLETKENSDTLIFNNTINKAQALFLKSDFTGAINAYNEALKIKKSEHAYSGKYFAELAANKFTDAEKTILLAIGQNNKSSDYWNWYLTLIQERLGASKTKLTTVYKQAFESVVSEKKINIVTHYAQILTKIGDKKGAIEQWKKAIEIYPQNKDIYQLEITNLEK